MIFSRSLLAQICSELRNQKRRIVFTNGCFDILHSGHTAYLEEAKKLGDILIVGLNTDESVRRLKGSTRPLNSQDDRALVLSSLRSVNYVCIFEEDTPFELISALQPDVLVKGGDYRIENIIGADIVQQRGGDVVTIAFVEGKSTTAIIQKIVDSSHE